MDRGTWRKPVVLEMYGRPGLVTVSDTLEAALTLLGAWPAKRSEAHVTAVTTCRDVLTGKAIAGLARADFIEAALDAGYHVQPETFLDAQWTLFPSLSDDLQEHFDPSHAGATQLAPPIDVLDGRQISGPVISWDGPPSDALRPERIGMRELLVRLAEILGMILLETCRNAADLLNIDIDARRRPNRGIR
ncbi:DUF982 domain-containing protein [Neorhizobium sp. DT-125]|uniref:DUF982 domain-containing protein n=1 Tax=Neorhizobium sp. DT-125 TaxID=3396163 RepID=UPI003F1AE726